MYLEPSQRFRKLHELGKGAQGVVHLCEDMHHDDRLVAVKYMHRGMSREAYKYVVREVLNHQELSSYRHPHIVEFHEVFLTPKYLGCIMEYGGVNLGEFIRMNKSGLSEETGRFLFHQLVSAIDFCHRCGKGHRDIKPGNILIRSINGFPILKLCDFGFCKDQHLDSAAVSEIGTAMYAAPEVVHLSPLWNEAGYNAQKVDVWSCGIVMFVLLFGIHPFVPTEYVTSGRSCIMLVVENSIRGELLLPDWAEERMPVAVDLIRKILVAQPDLRYSVEDILAHPWFQNMAPVQVQPMLSTCDDDSSNQYWQQPTEDDRSKQYWQHPNVTASLIELAASSTPEGPPERLQQAQAPPPQREMSLAEQAAIVQHMLREEARMVAEQQAARME